MGSMGVVTIGTITQVISWGNMATFVGFDTRISHRSVDPTLGSPTFLSFALLALRYTNLDKFLTNGTKAQKKLLEVANSVQKTLEDPSYTMIGENIETLRSNFTQSKALAQPWQIWMTATALGRSIKGNYVTMGNLLTDTQKAADVNQFMKRLANSWLGGILLRAIYLGSITNTPWNRDDFSGFAHEQREILKLFNESSLNPIVLAGDLHDSFAWQLYEDGLMNGTPTAVNLVCPGVTAPVRFMPRYSSLHVVDIPI
jgi:phosphodiesterase/alkaline phosphatase D-like protein